MATQLMFSDLMAAAAVVASSSASSVGPTNTSTSSNGSSAVHNMDPAFYSGPSVNSAPGQTGHSHTKGGGGNYLEDQRALQLAFELSMLNNNNNGATDAGTNGGASNSSSMSSSSSMGHSNGDMNQGYYFGHQAHTPQPRQQGNDYDNVLQHFLGSGSHEPVLNNIGSAGQHYHQQSHVPQQQQHQQFDDMTLEKFLLNQNGGGGAGGAGNLDSNGPSDYFNHQQRNSGHMHMNHQNSNTLNSLINGISSINLNNLTNSVHGYSNGGHGQGGNGGGGGGGGMMNETERFKKSQNMTECVPVPSSEHVAEIVGRQGCKIKALRAKTNTYIKTPVRGEEPVFVVTGRKEDVAKAKKEILSAAEHFSLIRASRKPSLTNGSSGGGGSSIGGVNSMAGSPLLAAASGSSGLGDIFSSSSSGDDSPSILTKNPIGLNSAAAVAAAAGHNQITVQVRVPYRVVGLVVGPKGATIKNIQQQTHTYIVTPSRDKEPIFEVTGAVENVEIARQQIEAHIAMRTGGNSESTDNLTNYLNSINSRPGMDLAMKKELQDELQLLNENFGQSTTFLRKYLNGSSEEQAQDSFGGAFNGDSKQQSATSLAAMELLMSQLYNQDNQVASGGAGVMNDVDIPSSVDLFGNRIRIDELLQTMQQKQNGNGDAKREADHLSMCRNSYGQSVKAPQSMGNNFFGSFPSDTMSKIGQFGGSGAAIPGGVGGGEDQGILRRQLLSNNSEDDEGVGLELQESSPPNTSTNLMKMIMDGTEENKKYLWSTLSAAVAGNAPGNNAVAGNGSVGGGKAANDLMGNVNHSSDSSCLSSASPSPTLSKFFTFQNGAVQNGSGSGSTERSSQEVELASQLI